MKHERHVCPIRMTRVPESIYLYIHGLLSFFLWFSVDYACDPSPTTTSALAPDKSQEVISVYPPSTRSLCSFQSLVHSHLLAARGVRQICEPCLAHAQQ